MEKIVFYIMTEKGFEVLKRVITINLEIIEYIVVGIDSNVKKDFSNEIMELAKVSNLRFYKRGEEPAADKDIYIFAISWRWMIDHPSHRLVVFHDSILPKYRGFSPLVNMLINGEKRIGVSAIFGASEYDRGDLISQQSSNIEYPIKIHQAIQLNNKNYIRLIEKIITQVSLGGDLIGVPQNEGEATYSIWRGDDDYNIDWRKSAHEIKRFIDSVGYPYFGAQTTDSNGDKIRVLESEVVNDVVCELRHVGKVIFIDGGLPTVICGKGLLRINQACYVGCENNSYLPMKSFRIKFV